MNSTSLQLRHARPLCSLRRQQKCISGATLQIIPPAVCPLKIRPQSMGIDKDISGPSVALITLLKEKG